SARRGACPDRVAQADVPCGEFFGSVAESHRPGNRPPPASAPQTVGQGPGAVSLAVPAAARLRGIAMPHAGALPRLLIPALLVVGGAAACLPMAFHGMFSGFQDYDDEGYLLISLRNYARGGVLYDQVYTQYGPAYYQLLSAVFRLLGLGFTHVAGRAFVMALWITVPALCAWATYRLTRNLVVSLATQLLVVWALVPPRDEPPPPGGLLSLLLGAVVVAGTFLESNRRAMVIALIGALLGAATLMKINVGLFAVASTVFVML